MNLQENIFRLKKLMGVIVEQIPDKARNEMSQLITQEGKKVKNYYLNLYSDPKTIAKFSNKANVDAVKRFIPTISFKVFSEKGSRNGYVKTNDYDVINLNILNLFSAKDGKIVQNGTKLYDTILHEMAHSIDFKMKDLGEKTISTSIGYYDVSGDKDEYVSSDLETFARVQRMREIFGLGPMDKGSQIKNKIVEFIRSKRFVFPNVKIAESNDPVGLIFVPPTKKGKLTQLWGFYDPIQIDGNKNSDLSALFAKFSVAKDGKVFLNLDTIGKVNVSTKAAPSS
jgi:hypothetical protein